MSTGNMPGIYVISDKRTLKVIFLRERWRGGVTDRSGAALFTAYRRFLRNG